MLRAILMISLSVSVDHEASGIPHTIRCMGTFVGHQVSFLMMQYPVKAQVILQGPVWALTCTNDLLFSGSTDETIKVWNASTNFSCLRTLSDHRGIIHVLVVFKYVVATIGMDL